MLRRFCLLLIVAAVAWAEDPDWTAYPVADPRREGDAAALLNQEVEGWVDRNTDDEVDYLYDHFEIWTEPYFEISLGVWGSQLSGPIRFGENDLVDVSKGLGLGEVEISPMWGTALRKDWWEIVVDGFFADLSGVRVVDLEFELPTEPPTPVRIGDIIASRIEVTNVRFLGGWRVYRTPAFTVSLLMGLSVYGIEGFIRSEGADAQLNFDVILPIPVFGVALSGRFGKDRRWEYRVEVVGIAVSVRAFGGSVVDTRGTIGYRVTDWFVIRAGYRYANIGAFFQDLRVDFEIEGPFLEFVGEF